jgi:CheY-like chemotaxis protein
MLVTNESLMIHVLYIEDDELLARSTLRFFRRHYPDAVVSHVDNSVAAVACLQSAQFDVVLSDFDLAAGGSGDSVLTWIEQNQPHLKPRFLFLSGNAACADRGVPWLEKPCSLAALAAAIADVLKEPA